MIKKKTIDFYLYLSAKYTPRLMSDDNNKKYRSPYWSRSALVRFHTKQNSSKGRRVNGRVVGGL